MTSTLPVAPIRVDVVVEAGSERCFETFTAHMERWWNPSHRIGEHPFVDIVLEPRVGGRWFEKDATGEECEWGSVLSWDPPSRLVLAWQLDSQWRFDPDLVTEVELTFTAVDDAHTRVTLEHRHLDRLGDDAAATREAMSTDGGGWGGLLQRFGDAV